MTRFFRPAVLLLFVFFTLAGAARAQAPRKPNAAELHQAMKRLNVLGSALYVAAHPDDENTRLITWLTNEQHVRTGYLSLTRGDGGQNLVGTEISEQLGMIRTQELLAARRIDGAEQFFSRANDFGYSKTPEETFNIWDREQVLADMVWTIRKFRPDVVITRFSKEPGYTHGHHTASALLALDAFEMAGDKTKFPEQLQYVEPWQPKRLVWNTSWWFYRRREIEFDPEGLIGVDIGEYNPLLGKSYNEIAAESRSQHKSQGFGRSTERGSEIEYFEHLKGPKAENDLFEGVDLTWDRVPGGKAVGKLLERAWKDYNPLRPAESVPLLVQAWQQLQKLPDGYWKDVKSQEIKAVVRGCLGLYLEAAADDFMVTPGDTLDVSVEILNRGTNNVRAESLGFMQTGKDTTLNAILAYNKPLAFNTKVVVPANMNISQPFWLERAGTKGMFDVPEQELRHLPENPPAIPVEFVLTIEGETFKYYVPLVYKESDPVKAEVYKPLAITPPVFANLADEVVVFPDQKTKQATVTVTAGKAGVSGTVKLKLPPGWQHSPKAAGFELARKGESETFTFDITPPAGQSVGDLIAVVTLAENRQSYSRGLALIEYDHIPSQVLFPESKARLVKVDLKKQGENVGYIMGAGDKVPESLEQIGYNVTMLEKDDLTPENLKQFDAVIVGVRAYNTHEWLSFYQQTLFDYVKQGGAMIVQYSTSYRLKIDQIGPYPLELSRERVTVEEAEVRFLAPEHPVLNTPNKITQADFEDWVQERGLYFAGQWDDAYTPVLSANDPGDDPRDGGMLVAKHGEGYFVYTGYSWFRELPAGVPGAFRIFANMISLGGR